MKNEPFRLIPLVGDEPADILQSLDGASSKILQEPEACQSLLKAAVRPFVTNPSPYEAPLPPEQACLAAEAAARESQRLGLPELSIALTEPSVRHRQAIEGHLAEQLTPQPPAGPQGPQVGWSMGR